MEYRSLGRSGLKVSAIGLGTNSFGGRADERISQEILMKAVEGGVTLIDTANIYSDTRSETLIGEVLATSLKGERDRLVVATKGGLYVEDRPNEYGSGRKHLMREVEESLRRLHTDYIDLYQIHTWDEATPLEETLSTLDALVRSGKVRYVGCSNYRAWETMKALWTSDRHHLVRYGSVQLSYSLADRTLEREIAPMCLDQGLGVIPYLPLAGGILSGKYNDGVPEGSRADKAPRFKDRMEPKYLELAKTVEEIAREMGATSAQVSLAWLLTRPAVSSVIAGATRVAQVEENLGASALQLSPEILQKLEVASEPFLSSSPFGDARL